MCLSRCDGLICAGAGGGRAICLCASATVEDITLVEQRICATLNDRKQVSASRAGVHTRTYNGAAGSYNAQIWNASRTHELILTPSPHFYIEVYEMCAQQQFHARHQICSSYRSEFLFPVAEAVLDLLSDEGVFVFKINDRARRVS